MNLYSICQTIVDFLTLKNNRLPAWPPETWAQCQRVCHLHGVAAYLHHTLRPATWLETDFRDWLAGQHQANQQRIAKMQAELAEILAVCGRHNLPVMPLKGAILTAHYYDSPGLRPMADLDLLIRPADLEPISQLLAQIGYVPQVTHWKHTEFSRPDNRQVVDATCEHPDNPRKLEIHCYCRESFGGLTVELTDAMWESATSGRLLDQPAILPTPTALVGQLLIHATYHLWQGRGRLIQLLDLVMLESKRRSDLTTLNAWLNHYEARFSYPALLMWHKYFPSTVNQSLVARQRGRVSDRFHRWADSLDLVNSSYLNPKPPGLYTVKAIRFSEGRPRELLQIIRFALLPRLEELALDHPRLVRSPVPWLAYFLLPWDWLRRLRRR